MEKNRIDDNDEYKIIEKIPRINLDRLKREPVEDLLSERNANDEKWKGNKKNQKGL